MSVPFGSGTFSSILFAGQTHLNIKGFQMQHTETGKNKLVLYPRPLDLLHSG